MPADIDMSGRIEETNRPTVVALANDIEVSILISAREKRLLLRTLAERYPHRTPIRHQVLVFSTLLYFVLREHGSVVKQVSIDLEYPGYEAAIKEHTLNLFRRKGLSYVPYLIFRQVGKKSPAHNVALKVFLGKRTATKVISARDVLKEFR